MSPFAIWAASVLLSLAAGFLAGIWFCSPDHMPPRPSGRDPDVY